MPYPDILLPAALVALCAGLIIPTCTKVFARVSGKHNIEIKDGSERLAQLNLTKSHELQAEYARTISLFGEGRSIVLDYPPDTGGDLPIHVSRHRDKESDYLQFKGGIYHLVFDLGGLTYAEGSDSPEDEIYSGRYNGPILPEAVRSWTISQDLELVR